MPFRVLAVNPGSTSTKLAIYEDAREAWRANVNHPAAEIARFRSIPDQLDYRSAAIRSSLASAKAGSLERLSAVVGRGGLLKPLAGGVYLVSEAMKADLASCRYGAHASNLGALIADQLAREAGVKAYIVDPVVVDELDPLARYTGVPDISRRSIFHALNQRAMGRRAAASLGKAYADCDLVVAHLGGGSSIGLHAHGRVVDVNNALDGDGPIAIERAGTVPAGDWMRFVLASQAGPAELAARLTGRGGLVAWLGTNEFTAIEGAAESWRAGSSGSLDGRMCEELISAMCYGIAKSICGLAAWVRGRLDAVVLTGGLAQSARVTREVTDRVQFLAPVLVYPGENELEALALGVLEVLRGNTEASVYQG